ncbi:uncharacterized protein LOC114275062 isoform X1 [Camellia sinensis]|uniref:uncharacterized protein LOC114275062 isoform X1 n=1 Tax=Camellia sinensis TaxID=4442 RepID=UPI0010366DD4|nr:uncharacterized protein LOC114275062 isoform X1 [Camellia sinensis]
MLGSNSQLREMMQNPEFIRQLTSPETMQFQQLMTLQQTLLSQLGRQPSTQEAGQTSGGTGAYLWKNLLFGFTCDTSNRLNAIVLLYILNVVQWSSSFMIAPCLATSISSFNILGCNQ